MLLFIGYGCANKVNESISIHLMLLFICWNNPSGINVFWISIHLMLLFIFSTSCFVSNPSKFQYISCYCLSLPYLSIYSLLFVFQYISCYCLSSRLALVAVFAVISIHLMLLFITFLESKIQTKENFNTSHVTVYLNPLLGITFNWSFQYISCYCLSKCEYIKECATTEFQYISCYCLSKLNTIF